MTESAVLAVIYALVVGVLVYRELPLRRLPHLFLESTSLSAMSMWLIASASVFTWLLARDQVPQMVSGVILSLSGARWFFLVASVFLFIFFAALLEGFPAVIILGPIFYPIAATMGVSTLHFSIIIVACVGIGLFLPPVGVGLFVACGIARSTMGRVIRPFATLFARAPSRAADCNLHPLDHDGVAAALPDAEVKLSTPRLKAEACSRFTLSRASLLRAAERVNPPCSSKKHQVIRRLPSLILNTMPRPYPPAQPSSPLPSFS